MTQTETHRHQQAGCFTLLLCRKGLLYVRLLEGETRAVRMGLTGIHLMPATRWSVLGSGVDKSMKECVECDQLCHLLSGLRIWQL